MLVQFLAFGGTSIILSIVAALIYNTTSNVHILTFVTFKCFHNHFDRYDVVSHCGFCIALMMRDAEGFFPMHLMAICISSLEKCLLVC